ncbi:hypothetical protein INR49_013497 [Caranx melampygus]|nr:hypothetical protein INR49_013497 [Caranx melampygus]
MRNQQNEKPTAISKSVISKKYPAVEEEMRMSQDFQQLHPEIVGKRIDSWAVINERIHAPLQNHDGSILKGGCPIKLLPSTVMKRDPQRPSVYIPLLQPTRVERDYEEPFPPPLSWHRLPYSRPASYPRLTLYVINSLLPSNATPTLRLSVSLTNGIWNPHSLRISQANRTRGGRNNRGPGIQVWLQRRQFRFNSLPLKFQENRDEEGEAPNTAPNRSPLYSGRTACSSALFDDRSMNLSEKEIIDLFEKMMEDMNLNEERKAPLRGKDLSTKREMVVQYISATAKSFQGKKK